jgi:hypothetical protein
MPESEPIKDRRHGCLVVNIIRRMRSLRNTIKEGTGCEVSVPLMQTPMESRGLSTNQARLYEIPSRVEQYSVDFVMRQERLLQKEQLPFHSMGLYPEEMVDLDMGTQRAAARCSKRRGNRGFRRHLHELRCDRVVASKSPKEQD